MKLTVSTELLKTMVAKAMHGSSNDKLLPITCLIRIQVVNGNLRLVTTDGTNYMYVTDNTYTFDADFDAVVETVVFSKLVQKLTSENVSLEKTGRGLEIWANGHYTIELVLDDDGDVVKYPDPIAKFNFSKKIGEIKLEIVRQILSVVRPSLATAYASPIITEYYVGESVVATDGIKACEFQQKLFSDKARMISAQLFDRLGVSTAEFYDVYGSGNTVVFKSDDCTIYGVEDADVSDYPIAGLMKLFSMGSQSSCVIDKSEFVAALDRLSLFVDMYDKHIVKFTFEADGLNISSKSQSGVEVLLYKKSEAFKPYFCSVDLIRFLQMVKSQVSDTVTVFYGQGKIQILKITDGTVTQIISLIQGE